MHNVSTPSLTYFNPSEDFKALINMNVQRRYDVKVQVFNLSSLSCRQLDLVRKTVEQDDTVHSLDGKIIGRTFS
jgi:hypothetical protein